MSDNLKKESAISHNRIRLSKLLPYGLVVLIVVGCLIIWQMYDMPTGILPTNLLRLMPDVEFQFAIGGEGTTGNNKLSEPLAVDISDDNGDIFVADTLNNVIKAFDKTGQFKFSFGNKNLTYLPSDIAVSGQKVFVVDSKHSRIQVFALNGTFEKSFAGPEIGKKIGAWIPSAIFAADNGDIYATDIFYQRVIVFDKTGQVKNCFGVPGSGNDQLLYPNGITVDSTGQIYVSDSNNNRIQVFDRQGKFLDVLKNGDQPLSFSMPRGIALSRDNLLYVTETFGHNLRILKLGANGIKSTAVVGERGVGADEMNFPNDLSIKRSSLCIADRANNRILVYRVLDIYPF